MVVKFDKLLDDDEVAVLDPRDIFLTLNRDKKFAFPRDIQTEVMKAWFGQRNDPDTVVKLNVGSGKTLVGLLLLQSSLNEGIRSAIYIAPDKQLVDQVLAEAEALGMDATDDPRDPGVQSGEKIAVTTVPLEGVAYQRLSAHAGAQAAAVQKFHQSRFLEATDRILYANQLIDDLVFHKVTPDRFEGAINSVAEFIGISGQRPEKLFDEGPDNLWALPEGSFLVIECKNNATSQNGISKADAGQLDQAMTWFGAKYPAATGTPVIVHPHRKLGDGATAVTGMRVMTEEDLKKLRKALEAFAKGLSDPDTLNNVRRVNELINAQGFGAEFLSRYCKSPQ